MKWTSLALAAALSTSLVGCASYDPYYNSGYNSGYGTGGYYPGTGTAVTTQYGTVIGVRNVAIESDRGLGVGAVVGAVIGGVAARELLPDRYRDWSTVVGAAAGGYIGDRIQDSRSGARPGQEITVRLDNGQTVVVVQDSTGFYSGQRVYVSGYGANARVSVR